MKPTVKSILSSLVLIFISASMIFGQKDMENYGNVPKTYVALR